MRDPTGLTGQGASESEPGIPPPEIVAEAAVWVARLHGPSRSRQMERECLAWQARSALHRLAFEGCTDSWQDVAGVTLRTYARATATEAGPISAKVTGQEGAQAEPKTGAGRVDARRWVLAFAATAIVPTLAGVLVLKPWWGGERYDTEVGEQRLVVLRDGTRMSLNTSTRVRVDLGLAQRTVQVEGGEALFEVAKDASRPFVVRAAGSEVRATGTAFVVRYAPALAGKREALDVTLVEGRVVVHGVEHGLPAAEVEPAVEMLPGQRLRFVGGAGLTRSAAAPKTQLDRPRMDQVLAWKRGEALFDNASLAEAAAEMNRYSAVPIHVADAGDLGALGGLRVSGVFKTGDNLSFARAVAKLHGLLVREVPDRVELAPR